MNSIANRHRSNAGYAKEWKVVSVYMQATGSNVQIFDCNFQMITTGSGFSIEQNICRHCTGNCREKHVSAMREASYCGNSVIYQCEIGLMFWVCPIYCDEKFTGALRGSGFLHNAIDSPALAEKCNALCDGDISLEKFFGCVSEFSRCDPDKIRSLSEILLLCAESLSSGNRNFHEVLRLRFGQKTSISVMVEELKLKYPAGTTMPGYPLEKERQLIALLQRGDKKELEKLLNEVMSVLIFSNPDNFRHVQLRAIELAVLLARAGTNIGSSFTAENNTRYLKQIQEAKTSEEVTGILHTIVENITDQILSFQGIPHALALRKAEMYIRENLTRKISLNEIAKIAGLSGPYFSTIFKEEMGENLSRYINRLRVEKASKMLLETNFSLSDISVACCFEDQSWFSKIFKSFTGMSPGKYRNRAGNSSTAQLCG